MARKQCAVCGDTCGTNVRLAWRRDRDGKTVNVCMACAEAGRVNADSIDNFTGKATQYIASEHSTKPRKSSEVYKYMDKSLLKARGRIARVKV